MAKRSATACSSPLNRGGAGRLAGVRPSGAGGDLVASLGPLPPIGDISTAQMLEAMTHDKKVVAGRLHFVLPTAIGATTSSTM